MEIDKDHIHFLIKAGPSISIGEIVARMKQISTNHLWESNGAYLKKFYWGEKRKLWTGGYFASTIGEVSENTVMEYIKNQG